jgi:hypothetical protein
VLAAVEAGDRSLTGLARKLGRIAFKEQVFGAVGRLERLGYLPEGMVR